MKLVWRDYQFAKEVLSSKYGFFERHPDDVAMLRDFVGLGLDNLTGEKWAVERRTLNSFFYQDVLKVIISTWTPIPDSTFDFPSRADSPS